MSEINGSLWRKSSYSDGGATCVEWAPAPAPAAGTGRVAFRDSKAVTGPMLVFPAEACAAFLAATA